MNDNISGSETIYKPSGTKVEVELNLNELFDERYRILERLGSGGMGTAYLAHDQLTNENVVIKIIHPSLLNEETKQRMIAEGVNARRIKHPNVVSVHDVKELNGQVYLTMEHVHGRPLRNWMATNMASGENAPVEHIVKIVTEVLDGLAAAHAAGVIHRDLKPENIMLEGTPGEDDIKVKIIDFGIATGLKAAGTTTTTGTIGAPLYMAPEQLTMPDAVRPNADIYSVGRMFYEMLMDVLPDGMWNPPSATRLDVPVALDNVIQKSLQPPKGRYASAKDFSVAITEGLATTVTPTPPPDPQPIEPEIQQPEKKRSLTWAYGIGLFIVAALLFDQFYTDPDDVGPDVFYDPPFNVNDVLDDDFPDEPPEILPTPPSAQSLVWRNDIDGSVFNMTETNGIVSGAGTLQPWGYVSLQGNPNSYLDVYDNQGRNVASISGRIVPSNSSPGLNDYSGSVMVNGQVLGTVFFHIAH